jgi:hypothetical protein
MRHKLYHSQPLKESSNGAVKPARGIQTTLVLAFMLPIACIVILGIVSYTKASNEIIKIMKNQ